MSSGKRRFKTILLDVGGTLDADGRHWRGRFHRLFLKRGYRIDPGSFARAYFDADDFLAVRYPLETMGLRETVRALAESLCRNLPGTAGILEDVARQFTEDAVTHINRNKGVLSQLKSRYRIGLVSNYYGNLENAILETGLDRYVDVVIDSDRIGARKPDPLIFWTALEALDSSPAEALFVGDSLTRDILGAQQIGISPLWLVPSSRTSLGNGFSVPRIHSFTELPEWLGAPAS
jgi:HAD superfamily hydrolase (TIGR01509 family)